MGQFKRWVLGIGTAAALLAPVSAEASIRETVADFLNQVAQIAHPDAVARPDASELKHPGAGVARPILPQASAATQLPEFNMPALPSTAVAELPTPRAETGLRKFFCVEYARIRSGLTVFGDAKFWWSRAKNLYARTSAPIENAVMVFSESKRLKKGHVAVVTHIVSSREIRVDQANWQNKGEIDYSTPVMDVSPKNDWSQVRVWDLKSASYGRIYPVTGFIFKELVRQASAQ